MEIPSQVFHPGFFFSTQLLLKQVMKNTLSGKKLLELGAGSGLISIAAAKKGAIATATDINPVAIDFLYKNSRRNNTTIEIIKSDLFAAIPDNSFDIIAINPPYYKKNPVTITDHAWYCGEKGEFFSNLFSQLKKFIHKDTLVMIVLCDGCDLQMIENMAEMNGFILKHQLTAKNLLEKNFIYTLETKFE